MHGQLVDQPIDIAGRVGRWQVILARQSVDEFVAARATREQLPEHCARMVDGEVQVRPRVERQDFTLDGLPVKLVGPQPQRS